MSTPRKHHYVPRFYLAGFTSSGAKDDRLFVLNRETRQQWPSNPGHTACERDFYMLEVEEGGDALALEKFFGKIENDATAGLRPIIERGELPTGDDYLRLVNFLAVMSVRGPGVLRIIDEFLERTIKALNWEMSATPERWQAVVEEMKREGKDISGFDWQKMREFVQSDAYSVEFNQNFRMQLILSMMGPGAEVLAARKWAVLNAPSEGPHFICSDRPLSVTWTNPQAEMGMMSPGLGLTGTSVMFPVNKSKALIGTYEGVPPIRQLDARGVGIINMWTALLSERFVYSSSPEFTVTLRSGGLGGKRELLSFLANVKTEASKAGKGEIERALRQLAAGRDVRASAQKFKLEQLRKLAVATATPTAGSLIVTHSDVLTDAQRASINPPPTQWHGQATPVRVSFV